MKIFVDAMGGDHSPTEIVKGCIFAIQEYKMPITLIGIEEEIEKELKKYEYDKKFINIIPTIEIIENDDEPVMAIRKKKNSSMVKGMELVKENDNAVFISAGNTGALLAGGLLKVGRINGILRPALAPILPTKKGPTLLIDAGANAECKSQQLQQFALMGSLYMEKVIGIKNPKVGLINIGIEEKKGTEMIKETFKLLKNSSLNFIGNIEARDIPNGTADILVCDGFIGNIVLKLTEGLAFFIFQALEETILSTTRGKIGALLLKPSIKDLVKQFDYTEYGGAPFLGINGGLIKAHGSSDAKAIKNAIGQGIKYLEKEVNKNIEQEIKKLKIKKEGEE
ncbi:phosphate acyltransferase PlsX [Garciella nitratireducens]|uniref:Phosphate acyltransferase n=1 Tax=Garciella nitratireducens DSM 15102 TaxID=1121911 RepID=A0A1T4JYS4_9FIRM|nr:phosphate acyltransferase PlsX [Garciella nitratireducens]RBP41127.1 phosphate:acyl-[acyl carrier protein] acyltransferase [Garciella nitratireducens]SJZ35185.1 phosphate:acyl-[acyl carrier protein] acyltransferase [Garciella nitratireducens DSM 15102]